MIYMPKPWSFLVLFLGLCACNTYAMCICVCRADTMQHNLHALQTEKDTVVQMFDALQKHNDSLKVQHDQ